MALDIPWLQLPGRFLSSRFVSIDRFLDKCVIIGTSEAYQTRYTRVIDVLSLPVPTGEASLTE